MDDAAISRAIDLALTIERDLKTPKKSLLVAMANDARILAIEAARGLTTVNPESPTEIRRLQNEVQRYRDYVAWIHAQQANGSDAFHDLAPDDQQELAELLKLPQASDA